MPANLVAALDGSGGQGNGGRGRSGDSFVLGFKILANLVAGLDGCGGHGNRGRGRSGDSLVLGKAELILELAGDAPFKKINCIKKKK